MLLWLPINGQELIHVASYRVGENESVVRKLVEDRQGFIWASTDEGLYRYDGTEIKQVSPLKILKGETLPKAKSIYLRDNGDYWFITEDHRAVIINGNSKEIYHIPNATTEKIEKGIKIYHVIFANDWMSYLSTSIGIITVDPFGNLIRNYRVTDYFDSGFYSGGPSPESIMDMVLSRENGLPILWMGGNAGLFKYWVSKDSMAHYPTPFINVHRPPPANTSFQIKDIYLRNKKMYTSSWGGGILIFDIEKETYERAVGHSSVREEIDVIFQLVPINESHLMGVVRPMSVILNTDNGVVDTISCRDQNINCAFDAHSAIMDKNGYLWMGHTYQSKLNKYSLDIETKNSSYASNIYISNFEIDGVSQPAMMDMYGDHKYTVVEGNQELEFEIRAINPQQNEVREFEYRFGEDDADWQGNESGIIKLSTPKQGNYTFEGRYYSNVGKKYKYTKKLRIYVPSPLWSNPVFIRSMILLLGFSILGLIGYLFYRRYRNSMEKRKLEDNIREVKHLAMQAQMNPHFIFNSLNSIRYLFLDDQKKEGLWYITKFAKLLRSTLNFSDQALVPLIEEIELTELYIQLEQLRFNNKFTFKKNYTDKDLQTEIPIPPFVIQPIVENAFWHGLSESQTEDKILSISINKINDGITISIEDNGVGIHSLEPKKDKNLNKTKSYGLSLIKERFEIINITQPYIYTLDISESTHFDSGTLMKIKISKK